jgi:RpiR family transcriptional regulator, carbohydrate utilization regulator
MATDNSPDTNPISEINSLSLIRSHLSEFAASEMRVAQWVLQNPEKVLRLPMALLAQECGVSDTTVLRFCRTIGFTGYTDLKLSIARDIARPPHIIHDEVDEKDDIKTIAQKIFHFNIQALQDTLEVMDFEALSKAIDLISQSKKILIIAVGTSGSIADTLYVRLFRLGLNCIVETDSYLQLMQAALFGPGDLVIGISQSGSSTDPILTLQAAKKNEASTICITSNAQSPITEYADVTLLGVSREIRAETIASRLALITIVDLLYVALSLRDVTGSVEKEKRIWEVVRMKAT